MFRPCVRAAPRDRLNSAFTACGESLPSPASRASRPFRPRPAVPAPPSSRRRERSTARRASVWPPAPRTRPISVAFARSPISPRLSSCPVESKNFPLLGSNRMLVSSRPAFSSVFRFRLSRYAMAVKARAEFVAELEGYVGTAPIRRDFAPRGSVAPLTGPSSTEGGSRCLRCVQATRPRSRSRVCGSAPRSSAAALPSVRRRFVV
jgi:hypothetical protein